MLKLVLFAQVSPPLISQASSLPIQRAPLYAQAYPYAHSDSLSKVSCSQGEHLSFLPRLGPKRVGVEHLESRVHL